MKYYSSSKTLQISLGISILLHIFVFLYINRPKPVEQTEQVPVSVEYFSEGQGQRIKEKREITGRREINNIKTAEPEDMVAPAPRATELPALADSTSPEGGRETVQIPYMRPKDVSEVHAKPDLFSFPERQAKIEEKTLMREEAIKEEATVSLQKPDIQFESYIRKVGEKIEGVWKYPEAAKKAGLQGSGVISFTLNRQGELIDVTILGSSGYPVLDEAIMDAVRKAAKYYPFQENMPVKMLHIEATFEYHLVSPGYIWIR